MSRPQSFLITNRKAEVERSSLENDRPPAYTSNVTTAPTHTLPGLDSVSSGPLTETLGAAEISEVATPTYTTNLTTAVMALTLSGRDSITDTIGGVASKVATPNYIYYRIYAEDGAIPSKAPATPGDPYLGRIKARSVPPPHTVKAVKHSIAKLEDIKVLTSCNLFLTPYSESPMGDADKVNILNRTGPGSTPQEPFALVAEMSESERSSLESESGGRNGLASAAAAEPDATSSEIRYLYYLLYATDYEMPSKAAFDPEEPSLGRIRANSVAPPHCPASIKRCISRVERTTALAHANIFADISCDTPLKEGHMSILRTDGPGLSPNEPMAIVQMPIIQPPVIQMPTGIVQVESQSLSMIPDGKYIIKNRAADIFWYRRVVAGDNIGIENIEKVHYWSSSMVHAKASFLAQWNITNDTNGNIFIRSESYDKITSGTWVGPNITWSTVPFPWRLIPADGKFYYLTADINRVSHNPLVPASAAVQRGYYFAPMFMAPLKLGDPLQMWEFIRV